MKTAAQAQDDYNQAVQAQTNNNLDQAITLYQKTISEAPSEPSYLYALGTAYQAKNDLDNAISLTKKHCLLHLIILIIKKSISPLKN